jgi:hypothetical protein
MSIPFSLRVVVLLVVCIGSSGAQQPMPSGTESEEKARKEVARQQREWEQRERRDFERRIYLHAKFAELSWSQRRELKQLNIEWKVELLRGAMDRNDREYFLLLAGIIAETMEPEPSSSQFDGIQWEQRRSLPCNLTHRAPVYELQ